MDSVNVVLTSPNPYGSRILTIECDRLSSVAYLRDSHGTVHGAVWLANHGPAPAVVDLGRLNAGRPPIMPRINTLVPEGRPPLDAGALHALWFEEGDGVAVYENDDLLAVIPGWADLDRGMPGYARDARGESPFAWSLSEAREGLAPRIRQAQGYWQWRMGEGMWQSYRQFLMSHLESRVGPPGRFWDASGHRLPTIGVTERPGVEGRDFTVLCTVGMSCQRMPSAEMFGTPSRIELATATRQDPRTVARLFVWLGQYPWRSVTWLGDGHTARWYHDPGTFPLKGDYCGVLLLSRPGGLPDLSGFMFGGEPVSWLWLVPLTDTELRVAAERGPEVLTERLAIQTRI